MSVTISKAAGALASPSVGTDRFTGVDVTAPSPSPRDELQAALRKGNAFADVTAPGPSSANSLDPSATRLLSARLSAEEQVLANRVLTALSPHDQVRIAESLVKLSEAGLLSQQDRQGRGTLLEALATVASRQTLHPNAPEKASVLRDMVSMAVDPLHIAQGERPLCGPTETVRVALRQPPADLAWMTAELVTRGETKLASGAPLKIHAHLDSKAYAQDGGIRQTVLMLSASLMDQGQGSYNVQTGKSSGTIHFVGKDASSSYEGDWSGMYPNDFQRSLQLTTGYKHQAIYTETSAGGGAEVIKRALESVGSAPTSINELERRYAQGEGVQTLTKWASGGSHLEHYVSILGTCSRDGKEYVVFSNPQGPSGSQKEQTFIDTPGIELPNGMRLIERSEAEALITATFINTEEKVNASTAMQVDDLPKTYTNLVQETLYYSPEGTLEVKSFLPPINTGGPEARGIPAPAKDAAPAASQEATSLKAKDHTGDQQADPYGLLKAARNRPQQKPIGSRGPRYWGDTADEETASFTPHSPKPDEDEDKYLKTSNLTGELVGNNSPSKKS